MFKTTKLSYYKLGAAMTAGMLVTSSTSHAAATNFNSIATQINNSIASLPALISALAYLFGVLLAVLGIMKIKDHVENPTQTPLKDGAIRLCVGGALFALPMILDAMFNTIEDGGSVATGAAVLSSIQFKVT